MVGSASPTMNDLKPRKDLTLEDVENEDWLVRSMAKVDATKTMDLDPALMDELQSIMAELSEDYHQGKPRLPVIREKEDLEELALKEARYLALLSRVAEIGITLFKIRKRVEDLWDTCEERINRYPVVTKELTNDRKRTLFYRAAMRPLREKQSKIELMVELAKTVENHLAQVHFAVKEISAMGRDYLMKQRV